MDVLSPDAGAKNKSQVHGLGVGLRKSRVQSLANAGARRLISPTRNTPPPPPKNMSQQAQDPHHLPSCTDVHSSHRLNM